MHTKTQLMLAVIAALGLTASSAFATTDSTPAGWRSWQNQGVSNSASQFAKKGRGGQDDLIYRPQQPEILGAKGSGKNGDGLEDALQLEPEANDIAPHASKGRGKDGIKPEDNGVDAPDAFDDNGIDLVTAAGSSTVLLAAKGRGKDGNKPEDNGVDAPDACDDNGNDLACV